MDEYTLTTKEWLDQRFKDRDDSGVYKSHAPIYGFNKNYIYLGLYKNNYTVLKEIQKLSSQYKIETFLEVGCAEGFTAYLVKNIFGFQVTVCDLSVEAVKRAKEIYGINGFDADVQSLNKLKDNSYDLVLCSETLEHVPFPEKAFSELLRVTKKVLIITVPAAKNLTEKKSYIPPKTPHTHLNIFTKEELEKSVSEGKVRGISNKLLSNIEYLCLNNDEIKLNQKPGLFIRICHIIKYLSFPLRKVYGITLAKILIKLDYVLCSIFSCNVNTYIGVYEKMLPEYNNRLPKSKNILKCMMRESKVEPYIIKGL